MHADGRHWQPRAEPHSLVPGYHAGAGELGERADSGRPNWVFRPCACDNELGVGKPQAVRPGGASGLGRRCANREGACEKLYSSIAVSKRGLAPEWRGGSTSSGPISAGSVTFRIVVFFYRRPPRLRLSRYGFRFRFRLRSVGAQYVYKLFLCPVFQIRKSSMPSVGKRMNAFAWCGFCAC